MEREMMLKCQRCNGPMIREMFRDMCERHWGWKCMICGEIIDPVILENRQAMMMARGGAQGRYQPAKAHA